MTRFYFFWAIALCAKFVLATWLPFSSDEAYYWVWGHHPQLSYFDHPPFVGWLFWLGQKIDFGGQSSRLPAVLLGHCTLLIWHVLLRPFLSAKSLTFWLGFVLLSPFLGIGSLIVTPDLPLMFFWSLAILVLLRALKLKTRLSYAALGAVLGLGFCAKYHMVLFVPIAWVWLIISGKWREIRFGALPLAILSGLLFCMPVWFWNYQNDWVSFRFQLAHGLAGGARKWSWPVEYLLGQIALIFPPLLFLALRRRESTEAGWLHAFAWLPLLFFLSTSFKARVEANWPVIAHPAILSLAFLNGANSRWLRGTMAVWALALLIVFSQVMHPWLPIDPRKLKTAEFSKFDPLLDAMRDKRPFYAGSYQMASALSYKRRELIYKLGGMNRRDFYDFQPNSYPETDVFYVAAEQEQELPTWLPEKGYAATLVQEIKPTEQTSHGLRIFEVKKRAENSDR